MGNSTAYSANPEIVWVRQGGMASCLECYWVCLAQKKASVSGSTNSIGVLNAILRMCSIRRLKNLISLTTASNHIVSLSNQSWIPGSSVMTLSTLWMPLPFSFSGGSS
jgi:hypothetical protein